MGSQSFRCYPDLKIKMINVWNIKLNYKKDHWDSDKNKGWNFQINSEESCN